MLDVNVVPMSGLSLSSKEMSPFDLVQWVGEPGFTAEDEYARMEDLDARFIAINNSHREARKWNDKTNR